MINKMNTITHFLNSYNLFDEEVQYYNIIIDDIASIINGNIKESYINPILANYAGLFYEHVKRNLRLAKKYYLMAISNNSYYAMNNLARLHKKRKKYKLAKKYYKMAVRKGDPEAMRNLGLLYQEQNNYNKAVYYYSMSNERDYYPKITRLN